MFKRAQEGDIAYSVSGGDLPSAAYHSHNFLYVGPLENWDEEWDLAVAWCRDQFGEPSIHRRWFSCRRDIIMCFRSEIDATAFRMRWG